MRQAMKTAGTLLLLTFYFGCGPSPRKLDGLSDGSHLSQEDRIVTEASARKSFDRLYRKLQKYRRSYSVRLSSRTDTYNDCEAFRKIVDRREDFLPFIIEKIEEGDFFLNQAMWEITGVNVRALYPDEKRTGERSVSRLWVRWWNEKSTPRDTGDVADGMYQKTCRRELKAISWLPRLW